jgi:hypothetical protein
MLGPCYLYDSLFTRGECLGIPFGRMVELTLYYRGNTLGSSVNRLRHQKDHRMIARQG